MSIKGHNSVVNLRKKTKIYITNVDLVKDNVYTKFDLNLSIRSHDMGQKPNSDVNQGTLLCCKFAKTMIYKSKVDLVNDIYKCVQNMCTNIQNLVLIGQFVFKILSKH